MSKIRLIIISLLTCVLLLTFFLSINYSELKGALIKAKVLWIIIALAVGLGAFYVRVVRWHYLLLPIKDISGMPLFKAIMIGFSVTIALPGRIGELVRPYLIGVWENISKSAALATVVLERIIDMLCVLTYFAIYLYFFSEKNVNSNWFNIVRESSLLALIIGVSGLLLLIIWGFYSKIINRLINILFFWSSVDLRNKIIKVAKSFSNGLLVLRDPRLMAKVILLSFIFWFIIVINTAFIIWAFAPQVKLSEAIFVMGLLVIGIALPTPGGVGGFHWAVRLALVWIGVSDGSAAAIALVDHIISVVPVLIIGLFFIWKEGLNWSKLTHLNAKE